MSIKFNHWQDSGTLKDSCENIMWISNYLKQKKYEKEKEYWRNVIYDDGIRYSWSEGVWGPVPDEAYGYFSHEELLEIYAERERDEQELQNLLEELE